MKRLWSPWRMKYIVDHSSQKGCVFCEALSQSDEEALIIARGRLSYVILNRYPYTSGHLMVIPFAHEDTLEKITTDTLAEMMLFTQRSLAALRQAYRAQAFNFGANIGEPAGAGVACHVHLHIVPRWSGDTNFMTVLGEVRVLPESLEDTRKNILRVWK